MQVTRLLVMILALAGAAHAAVSATATIDRARTQVGQPSELTIELTGSQRSEVPRIDVPDGLDIEYRGQSTNVSFVNGTMSTSVSHSFSVTPQAAGTYRIGPIEVPYAGGVAHTEVIRLVVAAGRGAPSQPLRLVAHVPRTRLYLHERVPLSIRLEVGNVQVADVRYPTLPGQGVAVEGFSEPTQRREHRAGRGAVQVVDFRTTLVPVRTGRLTLEPAQLVLSVLDGRRGGGLFGNFFGQRRQMTLHSEPIELTVLPLPTEGRPEDFSGAVGQLTLEVTAEPLTVAAGDPVTVTMQVRGTGNLGSMKPPSVAGGERLKVYDPTELSVPNQTPPIQERRFEQVVIPSTAGVVVLPPLTLSYFDPSAEQYRRASGRPMRLAVEPGVMHERDVVIGATGTPDEPQTAETLGRDIVFIKDDPGHLRPIGDRRHRRSSFWLAQTVPLLAWLGVLAWDRRRRRLSEDPRFARFVAAGSEVGPRLSMAEQAFAQGRMQEGVDAVARGVHEYLAAKLDLRPGEVTAERVGARLEAAGLGPDVVAQACELLATCEQVRFQPTAANHGAALLSRARDLVRGLDRERRLTPPVIMLLLAAALVAAVGATAETPRTMFARGNTLYADGHFTDAAVEYERVLATELESGPLYFNLGNAHLRGGKRGHAILNYERAKQLMPGDADLEANLRFATDDIPVDEGMSLAARIAFPLATSWSTDTLLLAASVSYWVLVLALCLVRLWSPGGRAGRAVALGLGAVLLLTSSAAAYRVIRIDLPSWAVALEDTVVRFEPSSTGTVHYEAPEGVVLEVLVARDAWMQVARRSDGRRGWIAAPAVGPL